MILQYFEHFLGGGVQESGVFEALRIITSDARVKVVLVNIFGGIVNCEIIARGVNRAYEELGITTPLVCRLEGTNVDSAKEILAKGGHPVITSGKFKDTSIFFDNIFRFFRRSCCQGRRCSAKVKYFALYFLS
jgi:succinyl-CoA synthetase beta subunit